MVLLDLLHRLAPEHGWRVAVAHANHGWRGEESDGDERLVREAADRAGLEFVTERLRPGREHAGLSVEMAAREGRHRFLARAARERGIGRVVLAHHADDQIELFLLRLLRGAGSDGLGGMRSESPSPFGGDIRLIRPLLGQSRRSLRDHARSRGLAWREDGTNRDPALGLRNRIRNEWLPRMMEGETAGAILRTMEILEDEHRYIDEQARRWRKDGAPFGEAPVALQREILRIGILETGLAPGFRLVERLRHAPAGTRISAEGKRLLVRDDRGMVRETTVAERDPCGEEAWVELQGGSSELDFGGVRLRFATEAWRDQPLPRGPGEEVLDAAALGSRILLRHWHPGDRLQPIGMTGRVKLQDWFVNRKIPARKRHRLVVGQCSRGNLFWVEGLRIGERFRVTPGTRKVVRLQWERLEE